MDDCRAPVQQQIAKKMPAVTVPELNNNSEHMLDGIYRPRSESRASTISSASSSNETSEEMELPEVSEEVKPDDANESPDKRRFRSMSDGCPAIPASDQPFEVFPSLPDSVLQKMGLLADSPKERLNDDESEQKFVGLALAFSIDAITIKDRCHRQRRYRDQTDKNLATEIDRLIDKVYRLQPLCIDAETTEMLSDLLAQVDIVVRAAAYAAISAERFGAVQHEDRLAQAVEVMIKHVTLLKQQRDSARKHLQYTKRMLQNTNNLNEVQTLPRTKTVHSRRASIANINQPSSPTVSSEPKRIMRRTSELSIRATAHPRPSRPSRLELGVDLVKIREFATEDITPTIQDESLLNQREEEEKDIDLPESKDEEEDVVDVDTSSLPFRQKVSHKLRRIRTKATNAYRDWCDNTNMHELFLVATLLCFSLSIITLGNILVELEYARNGVSGDQSWSLDNFFTNLFLYVGSKYEQQTEAIVG